MKYECAVEYFEDEETTSEDEQTEEVAEETTEIVENTTEPSDISNENVVEEAVVEVAETQTFESFEVPSEDSVEPFDVESSIAEIADTNEPEEQKETSSNDDFGLPDGFDMSELADLDDLLNDAGL